MSAFLYNPDRKPKDYLISEFVVRNEIYEQIMHDLETSPMKHPEQHYLIVGQRGAGKTTLLARLKYGIEDSPKLRHNVIPVMFSEEQYNISELVNLWENIAQNLGDYHGFHGLTEQIEQNLHKENFEELSYDILENRLRKHNKKLVLLIDNVGDILKKMDIREVRRFREILQTKNDLRLIAGSPFYLDMVLDVHQPLFEFFKVIKLDGLDFEQTKKLLLKLGEIHNEAEKINKIINETPERIETLRTLTGGVPRTIALMFKIFVDYNNEDTVKDLERILDAVTPLYKHRMDDLPTQQQKIVDAVAKNWDGISVKELTSKLRLESKVISAQLRQLDKNQLIEVVGTGTKNNIYRIKERFFNIWYLMRYGRKYDKQRVIWLVKFLESWCSSQELEQRILDYVNKIQSGQLDSGLVSFYGEIYTGLESLREEIKFILKKVTPKHLSEKINLNEDKLIALAIEKQKKKEYVDAFEILSKIQTPDKNKSVFIITVMMELLMDDRTRFLNWFSEIKNELHDGKGEVPISYFNYLWLVVFYSYSSFLHLSVSEFQKASASLEALLKLADDADKNTEWSVDTLVSSALVEFLVCDQPNLLKSVFDHRPVLKEKFKPTYYATLKIMQQDYEVLKMAPEIEKTVNSIIAYVKQTKKDYQAILNM